MATAKKKVAYPVTWNRFKEKVNRIAMEAVWRVFHCTSAYSLDQSEELAFYQDLAKTMHAGIDEQMQSLTKSVTASRRNRSAYMRMTF